MGRSRFKSWVGSGSEASGRDLLVAAASGQGVRVARLAAAKKVSEAGASG